MTETSSRSSAINAIASVLRGQGQSLDWLGKARAILDAIRDEKIVLPDHVSTKYHDDIVAEAERERVKQCDALSRKLSSALCVVHDYAKHQDRAQKTLSDFPATLGKNYLEAALDRIDSLRAELAGFSNATAMRQCMVDAADENKALRRKIDSLTRERDAARVGASTIQYDFSSTNKQLITVEKERDTLEAKLAEVTAERDGMIQARDNAVSTMNNMSAQRNAAVQSRDCAYENLKAAQAEVARLLRTTELYSTRIAELEGILREARAAADSLDRAIGGVEIHGISTKGIDRAKMVVGCKASVQRVVASIDAALAGKVGS